MYILGLEADYCVPYELTHYCFRVPLEIVVWIYNTFDYNLGIKKDFIKYLKESGC